METVHDGAALRLVLTVALCFALLPRSPALDVHTEILPKDTVFFDVSLRGDWHYHLDKLKSTHDVLRHVDLTEGKLRMSGLPLDCEQLKTNPFRLSVTAHTNSISASNFTVIPLLVHVHGQGCLLDHKSRKEEFMGLNTQQKILLHTSINQDSCLSSGESIARPPDFIPGQLGECDCTTEVSSDIFMVEDDNLLTSQFVCFERSQMHVHGKVKCKCPFGAKYHWPLSLTLMFKKPTEARSPSHFHTKRVKRQSGSFMPPNFPQNHYVAHINEEQGAGVVVGTYAIEDENRDVSYSLLASRDGRSQDLFTIDATSGQVTTTKNLDREGIVVHYFVVYATDAVNTRVNGQTALTIYVDDVNDHAPEFERQSYAREVSESVLVGATILTVRASDGDIGPNADIEYSIVNPSGDNEVFRIDHRTGSIMTRATLDREKTQFYTLEIQAADKGPVTNRQKANAIVEITVTDENDNYPQFQKSSYTIDVSEDLDPSGRPVVAAIKATDEDDGRNSAIRYSITGGNSQNSFSIDSMNGQLSLLIPLDYELTNSYRLRVRAQDSGSPPKSNSTTVLVRVIDVNDNEPRFLTHIFQEAVLEDVDVGFTVMRVQAYDADSGSNAALIYSILNPPSGLPVTLDRHTGIITTNQLIDREVQRRYSFQVEAKDQGDPPRSATTSIEINIRDVNDNAPIFNPRVYYETVSEEDYPGTPVLTVTATDADANENARVTYTLASGNSRGAFNIISQMGQGLLTVARTLNYKEQSHYILTITATDPGNLVDTATVFINVTDANTYRPVFQGTPYQIRVAEDADVGTNIYKVLATDGDVGENARVSYTMDENDVFSINPTTGEITVKGELDREATAGFAISVTATDHGKPPKSDTTDVEIIVNDVNDNDPKFSEAVYNGRASEDAIVGSSILTIVATDDDEGLNGRIRYTFEGGNNGNGDFVLEPTLGILRVAKPLDRERTSQYALKAYAIDRGVPERSTSVLINIYIEDVNDNSPQFESKQINFEILENSPVGSTVDSLVAVDPDEGVNAEVEYSIVGGSDADSFALTTRPNEPAVLTTLVDLDYESGKTKYYVMVRARSFHLFDDVTAVINVIDVNDNMPQLSDFTVVFNNFRNHFPTGYIGRVPAMDPDVNDRLMYRFVSGNEASILQLNENTGYIQLDSRLNSDVPTNATLQVSVSDGINEVKATCRLYVRLVTQEMLFNSITIRLQDISQEAFLSPLYQRFTSALASIIPTSEDNVFLINVQDDSDVMDPILNVSFSVRRNVQNNRDVFYSQQFLRERVYLQRILLAKLSTLEVLPFDDNLCLREPCLNYEDCVSILQFGNASSVVSSPTMLFRPIHPINAVSCRCPSGFTGRDAIYLCDIEVNLCYSSPCQNNGSCIQREGGYTCKCLDGFTGELCDIDMKHKKITECELDVCKGGSRCAPLIRGGFRCEKCPAHAQNTEEFCIDCKDLEYHTQFCELTTRSFTKGTFLMFPSLKRRHRFTISLEFTTTDRNGLLFYNGRYNERHDFIALELVNGQLQFSFSLGTDVSRVSASIPGGVSDGNWHAVTIEYFNRTATLTVGEFCDTELAVQHGRQIGNYTCAARVTKVLEERCSKMTEPCHRFLDLTGPLQIGGLPSLPTEFQVRHTGFQGCIRNINVDQQFMDLNDFVYNNGTLQGCQPRRSFCAASTCKHGGVCLEAWGTYQCECTPEWGGKDCSQVIEPPRRLKGSSYLLFTKGFQTIQLPWYSGIGFRTRQGSALLMSVVLSNGDSVNTELKHGIIQLVHPQKTVVLDHILVNDGKWHFLEMRWRRGKLILLLDYSQAQIEVDMGSWVNGQSISRVYVGGQAEQVSGTHVVLKGLIGCVKDVRVGSSPNSILSEPQEYNVEPGCSVADPCDGTPCPLNSYCINQWEKHICACEPGFIGPQCISVCDYYSPCKNGAACFNSSLSPSGYTCECAEGFTGQYCESRVAQTCAATWWGSPICGPCNCPTERGFDAVCDKRNGECTCQKNFFKPNNSDTCFDCDCYPVGSLNLTCHPVTGQCQCMRGVIGRTCDSCSSSFAEVTSRGCEVMYDSCPRSKASGLWWARTLYGSNATRTCPDGSVGDAVRHCDSSSGWEEPDLTRCLSSVLVDVAQQMKHFETGAMHVNTYLAKDLMEKLAKAAKSVDRLYTHDVDVVHRTLLQLLHYESQQAGLNLTHTQDRDFIQNLVDTLGRTLNPEHLAMPSKIQDVPQLVEVLEKYMTTLAANMMTVFTNPFDSVSDNIVVGLDYVIKENLTTFYIPKFNNKVANPDMFDRETRVRLSSTVLSPPSMADMVQEIVGRKKPTATLGYIMHKDLGMLLPQNFDPSLRYDDTIPLEVNAPVFTLNVVDGNKTISGPTNAPIIIDFKVFNNVNYSNPQCVFWDFSNQYWSPDGCKVIALQHYKEKDIVSCECNHLSTFTVVMDRFDITQASAYAVTIEAVTYVAVAVGLLLLFVAMVLFCCLRNLHSNSNSIHINLVFSIIAASLIYICGINQTQPKVLCKVVAIVLHYFFMCTFAWMFVETLHLYRMLTEIRNINHGAMKFYYVIGYVVPGIIVGLAVGLSTDGYGNMRFCWLQTSDLIIWSLAGPIICIIALNIIVIFMAVFASCKGKAADPEFSMLKYGLKAALVLLPLLGMAWVFGLLSVNDNVLAFHYLFAVSCLLQGIFIFLAHVIFNKRVLQEFRDVVCHGKKGYEETPDTNTTRSVLAYHHESSMDALNRTNVGISTQSTTSRSTSKSSGGLYRPDGYLNHSTSTSTGNNMPPIGEYPTHPGHHPGSHPGPIVPYGYEATMFHAKAAGEPHSGEYQRRRHKNRHRDSDSESELSANEQRDIELASSHSSDDDEEEPYRWGAPKNKQLERVQGRMSSKHSSPASLSNTPSAPPPYSVAMAPPRNWPGEALSSTTVSDSDLRKPEHLRISDVRAGGDPYYKSHTPRKGSSELLTPPERKDSLPSLRSSPQSPREKISVKVLTHNGSITSQSEQESFL